MNKEYLLSFKLDLLAWTESIKTIKVAQKWSNVRRQKLIKNERFLNKESLRCTRKLFSQSQSFLTSWP